MAVTFGGSGVFPNGGGGGGGTATPGGSDTEVQYNDGGVLNGADGLTYTKATETTTAESVGAKVVAVTGLATPDAPTVTPNTVGEATWGYKVVALLADDSHSIASSEGTTVAGSATLEANVYNTIEWSAVAGANYYAVYRTTVATDPTTTGLVGTTTGLSLVDNALVGDTTSAPTTNTTGLVTTPQIKVTGGTPGSGKVLTSDAAGLGTWQAASTLSGGSAGKLVIWTAADAVTNNAATMADPTTGVVTLGPPATDVTMLTARASASPGTAHIAQFQASDNSPLSHIAHDGKFVGNVTGTASGNPTNSAGANVVPKSDGTNLVASSVSDNGTTLTLGNAGVTVTEATGAVSLTAQAVGTTPLTIAGTSGQTAPVLSFGPAAAAPIAVTIAGQDGSGTNVAGQTVTHRPGLGTGTGGSGSLILQAAPVDATGSAANTPQAVATFAKDSTTITTTTPTAVAATTAGNSVTIAASNATAGLSSAGAATGGSVTITAGDAARYSSGNALGGGISLALGSGIGSSGKGFLTGSGGSTSYGLRLYGDAAASIVLGAYSTTIAVMSVSVASNNQGIVLYNAGLFGWQAGTSEWSTRDVVARRKAAANPAWGIESTTPVAYTHTLSGESRAGTDTDVQGAAAILQPGNGTGTGGSGTLKAQTAYPGTTGTTANTYSDREMFAPKWTTLTESSATAIATLTYGASSVVGAEFLVTVEANDGTEYQSLTTRIRVSSVRKATGNTVSSVSIVGTDTVAASSGTLTLNAATITEGASAATLNLNVTSSLTQTTLRATWQAVANGPGLTLAQS